MGSKYDPILQVTRLVQPLGNGKAMFEVDYWVELTYSESQGQMVALRGGASKKWFWGLQQTQTGVYL